MRIRLNPIPRHSYRAVRPLRHRLATLWVVIVLLCLPTSFVVAGAINEVGLGGAWVALTRPASLLALLDIIASGDIEFGNYAGGQNETLYLAGQGR